jgi:hypothetical protein
MFQNDKDDLLGFTSAVGFLPHFPGHPSLMSNLNIMRWVFTRRRKSLCFAHECHGARIGIGRVRMTEIPRKGRKNEMRFLD